MLETRPSRRGVDDTRIVPFFGAEFSRVVIAARSLLLEQIIPDRSVTFPYNLQKNSLRLFLELSAKSLILARLNIFHTQNRRLNVD